MQTDKIRITIDTDGTIKLITDEISLPNHATAEDVIQQILTLSGGTLEHNQRSAHTHHHQHSDEHLHH
mgnify:FL=1